MRWRGPRGAPGTSSIPHSAARCLRAIQTTFGDGGTETARSLYFTLHQAGHDSLRLETGEVFENPRYTAVRGTENAISAHLNLRPVLDGSDALHASRMTYDSGRPRNLVMAVFTSSSLRMG